MAIQIHKVLGVLHETWEEEANFLAARQLVWRSSQSLPSLRGSKIARIFLVTQNLSCSVLPSFLNNALMSEMAYCHLLGLREPNGLIAAISKTKDYFKTFPFPPNSDSSHLQCPFSNTHTTWIQSPALVTTWTHHKQLGKVHIQIQSKDESEFVSHAEVL